MIELLTFIDVATWIAFCSGAALVAVLILAGLFIKRRGDIPPAITILFVLSLAFFVVTALIVITHYNFTDYGQARPNIYAE